MKPSSKTSSISSRPRYRQAVAIVRDHSLAADVVQETLIRVWLSLDSFREESPLKTWVMKTVHNVSISALRRRRDIYVDPYNLLRRGISSASDGSGRCSTGRFRRSWDCLRSRRRPVSGTACRHRRPGECREYNGLVVAMHPATIELDIGNGRRAIVPNTTLLKSGFDLGKP